ncbi:MAG: viroplasmin family protein [Blautia sp.]|nr:viroplasmin family protein [Lachnoclostridium sp.]MCM1210233.1 viroplasmin family protein [Blautia sp.]
MTEDKKYYAIRKGLTPGIYTSWEECQQNIKGVSGAEYKSFSTREDAETYLHNIDFNEKGNITSEAIAYVDGCFNEVTNEYSYGVIIFYNGREEHLSRKFNGSNLITMKNVVGGIEGTKKVMEFCIDNQIKSVKIFYINEDIEKWHTGVCEANQPDIIGYKEYYNSIKDRLKIAFEQVNKDGRGIYIDLANSLAKVVVGMEEPQNSVSVRDNGIVAYGIRKDDLDKVFNLLKKDFSDLKLSNKKIPYATQYELEIMNPSKQKLSVNLYKEKKKIWINGQQKDLFNRLTYHIIELLEIDEIPDFLNAIYKTNIDKDDIESEFIRLFSHSYNKLPEELSKYLHQAVFNLHVSTNVYTANYLVEPAIRPLEAILKIALKNNNIPICKKGTGYGNFCVFRKINDDEYKLKEEFILDSHSKDLLDYLAKCYTYYNKNRHTLFHWGDPTGEKDTTRILNTIEEAIFIIRDSIALIDEYYTIA